MSSAGYVINTRICLVGCRYEHWQAPMMFDIPRRNAPLQEHTVVHSFLYIVDSEEQTLHVPARRGIRIVRL